ncbi:MAG: luciferase [Halobacteriales archaeon]
MLTDSPTPRAIGLDAAALKPTECDLRAARHLPLDRVAIDYEGREHVPDPALLADLAGAFEVRVTAPVRADGFDPLGDDGLYDRLPEGVGLALVAGHPAYLDHRERRRAIAPRIGAMVDRASDPWVGTEGIERVALAAGGTQFELLAPGVERDVRGLRAAGFDGAVAVYAPTVLSADEGAILDSVGGYVARRKGVAERLPEGADTDGAATGRAREVLLDAATDYALVGDPRSVRDRIEALKEAGADYVVGYPARGVAEFCES